MHLVRRWSLWIQMVSFYYRLSHRAVSWVWSICTFFATVEDEEEAVSSTVFSVNFTSLWSQYICTSSRANIQFVALSYMYSDQRCFWLLFIRRSRYFFSGCYRWMYSRSVGAPSNTRVQYHISISALKLSNPVPTALIRLHIEHSKSSTYIYACLSPEFVIFLVLDSILCMCLPPSPEFTAMLCTLLVTANYYRTPWCTTIQVFPAPVCGKGRGLSQCRWTLNTITAPNYASMQQPWWMMHSLLTIIAHPSCPSVMLLRDEVTLFSWWGKLHPTCGQNEQLVNLANWYSLFNSLST
jgi:hypothetical protein